MRRRRATPQSPSRRFRLRRPGKTALYLAAEKGHAAAAGCLLRHGADPHSPAQISTPEMASRLSALWAARRGDHADVEAMLVAAGATERAELVPLEGAVEEARELGGS